MRWEELRIDEHSRYKSHLGLYGDRPRLSSDDDKREHVMNQQVPTLKDHGKRRTRSSPRTKRQSIAHLNELIKRQRDENRQTHARSDLAPGTPLIHREATVPANADQDGDVDEKTRRHLIQVAVRCRKRTARAVSPPSWRFELTESSCDEVERGEEGIAANASSGYSERASSNSSSSSSDHPSHHHRRAPHRRSNPHQSRRRTSKRVPRDSVLAYPPVSSTDGKPTVLIPSHALALGGPSGRRRFEFDHVLPPWKRQRDVFVECVQPLITNVLRHTSQSWEQGSNAEAHATIVAYGQTGTGKTYTMGMLDAVTSDHTRSTGTEESSAKEGIIPRALRQILTHTNGTTGYGGGAGGHHLVATMSFLQIYLETIQDLLAAPEQVTVAHNVRWQPVSSEFYVDGLSEWTLESVEQAQKLLALAARNRVLAATARNRTSSRSHTVLTITIKCTTMANGDVSDGSDEDDRREVARHSVSFVDLAGSERVQGSLHFLHATRKRQELRIREAKFINRSLSALGAVISTLATQQHDQNAEAVRAHRLSQPRSRKAPPHVRFRDSKLTKLLQSRLMNGHSQLLLIATVDDRPGNLAETLSTLKFATQCRRVAAVHSTTATTWQQRYREAGDARRVKAIAEVRAMYEAREVDMQRQFEAQFAALRAQLLDDNAVAHSKALIDGVTRSGMGQHLNEDENGVLSSAAHPCYPLEVTVPQRAAYLGLCSLTDHARRRNKQAPPETASFHPEINSFATDKELLKYIADMYHEIKAALDVTTTAVSPTYSNVSKTRTARFSHPSANSSTIGEASRPVEVARSWTVQKTRSLTSVQVPSATDTASTTNTQTTPIVTKTPTNSMREVDDAKIVHGRTGMLTLTRDQEVEFQAIAKWLFSTHALDDISISSDDDEVDDRGKGHGVKSKSQLDEPPETREQTT